ncbi:hypothetical protein C8F04DRAFT_259990 [Mycena alexandri]|uniref:Uncharacterized protein n=1 Tax=Mycena alexandri TaxID=1745969 RepID=A0AAD6S4T4_9AGAR|nr:hypothetical protein C8F04DRAFT_303252 [Mycena alexandri]KAJ7021794.1 hypothetical protein C8F04DRAFT_259990 [Mycena alexandri]
MNHPYSSAASFIYFNDSERPLPQLPPPAPPKTPYPSSSASSLPPNPPAYEESGWLGEDPYKASVSAISSTPPQHANLFGPDAALREYAQSAPLRPQRSSTFTPPPARTGKRDSDVWSIRSVGSVRLRARITNFYRKHTTKATITPESDPLPARPAPERRDSGPVSEWVDDEEGEDYEHARASSRSSGMVTTSTSKVNSPKKGPHSPWPTKGPPSPWPPTKQGVVIRYEGVDEPEALRRPAPVPYEKRPSERRLEDKKHDEWRQRMIERFTL